MITTINEFRKILEYSSSGIYYRNTSQEWLINLLTNGRITSEGKQYISLSLSPNSGGQDHYGDIRILFDSNILDSEDAIEIDYEDADFWRIFPDITRHVTGFNNEEEYYSSIGVSNSEEANNKMEMDWLQYVSSYESEQEIVIPEIRLIPGIIISVEFYEKPNPKLIQLLNKNNISYKIGEVKENFNRANYLKWKRKNVTYRGIANENEFNGAGARFGDGLYTASLSNKSMAKGYGELRFVVNGRPKNPRKFQDTNQAEIFLQNIITKWCEEQGIPRDSRSFSAKTNYKEQMLKLGYDGLEVIGREIVNYKPENVLYFKTEEQLINYYESLAINENVDNLSTDILLFNKETQDQINPDEYEIDKILDIITDVEEIKKLESNMTLNTSYKDVKNGSVVYVTCLLKPRNNSTAYPTGEMGVLKCKILETFYGLSKLNQLKNSNQIL